MDSAIWGFIGTLVGALASFGGAWWTSRNTYKLQAAAAERDRIERSNAFQRQTLVDLQQAIHDALRLTSHLHLQELKTHYEDGVTWGGEVEKQAADELSIAHRSLLILAERISDDDLRAEVKPIVGLDNSVFLAETAGEAQRRMQICLVASIKALESIGVVLRRYY